MSSIQIIMDRLTKLENENALFKSQIRSLKKQSNIKPQIINNIVKKDGLTKDDINKMICDKIPKADTNKITIEVVKELFKKTITLDYINRLYGK